MAQHICASLSLSHPGLMTDCSNPEWVFNNAGGAMGSMWIIHGSLSEYVIVFGSNQPIPTSHTGRYRYADDYFTILSGEQVGTFEKPGEISFFGPGSQHHLPAGAAGAYSCPDHCWALEYARGFIPSMLPFGFADTFSSTLDFYTLWRTIYLYGVEIIGQLARGKL